MAPTKTANNPMQRAHDSPRCGAHARTTGHPCKAPAMPNGRCRMHGGKSPGAPTGNRNGNFQHGLCTKEVQQRSSEVRELLKALRQLIG